MKKVENPQVKEYLVNFVTTTLENCDLFVKTFGKNYARNRLGINLDKVYTNEFNRTCTGYNNSGDNSITICTSQKDDPILTPEQLEVDKFKLATLLHESIHAILTRTKQECNKFGIISGSGIMEEKKNGEEIGRGLNEGLTNWICEKAGVPTESYPEITNFVKELELAVGEEKIMQLGKGNTKSISHLLDMVDKSKRSKSEEYLEYETFLGKADHVYALQFEIWQKYNKLQILQNIKNIEKLSANEAQDAIKEYVELLKNPEYIKMTNDSNYLLYRTGQKEPRDTIENRIGFISLDIKKYKKELENAITEVESTIFDKYFKKEFYYSINSSNILNINFSKFNKLNELMHKRRANKQDMSYSSERFQKDFEKVKEKYILAVNYEARKDFEKGKLTTERFKQLYHLAVEAGSETLFCLKVAEIMSGSNSTKKQKATQQLLYYLAQTDRLQDINRYSIYYSKQDENDSIPIFMKDNKFKNISNFYEVKQMKAKEPTGKNYNDVFDFTLQLREKEENIIREFLHIKEKIQKYAPDATISICDRIVAIDYGNSQSIYVIDKGMMLPVSISQQTPLKIQFQQDRSKLLPAKRKKDTIFSKLTNKIRQQLFRNPKGTVNYTGEEENRASRNEAKNFRKNMISQTNENMSPNGEQNNLQKQNYYDTKDKQVQNDGENR